VIGAISAYGLCCDQGITLKRRVDHDAVQRP
jgi:hypothetical protein